MATSTKKSLSLLVKAAVLMIGVELLLRFISGTHTPPEPYLVSDPILQYRLRTGWSSPSGAIQINSQGFRGDQTSDLPKDALLMIGVGGGDTFGRGVSKNKTAWPNRLDTLFKKNLPERNVHVMNAGVPGRSLLLNLIDLERRLVRFNPDFVLLMADIDHLGLFPPPTKTPKWRRWSLLISAIASRLFPPSRTARKDHWPGEATELLQQHLISIVAICRARNVRIVLSTIANTSQIFRLITGGDKSLEVVFPHLTPEAVSAAIRSYNEAVRRVALQYQVYLVDSAERGLISKSVYLDDEGTLQAAQGFLNTTRGMGLHKKQTPAPHQRRRGSIL